MSANEKPFVPSITTSTLGDRLEALRVTQQGYEERTASPLSARSCRRTSRRPTTGRDASGTARERERDQLMPIHHLVDGGRDVGRYGHNDRTLLPE